jgi:PIN domain nuclease of toxin-antitoxin system
VILLDTHAWLWWVTDPDRLSEPARAAIDGALSVGVSTLSAWEIAMLVVRGRISLDRDVEAWVRQAFAQDRVEALAPSAEIALAASLLDSREFPGDPIDRLIYATARAANATLITRDEAIREFDPRLTLW